MPLNRKDQVSLLKDILSNHSSDCSGSVSECEQLERLVKSLMAQSNHEEYTHSVLQEIYHYCQQGAQSANLDDHIEANQQRLSQWVENIDQLS